MQPTLASKLRLMNPTTEVIATIGLAGQAIKASEKDCKIEIGTHGSKVQFYNLLLKNFLRETVQENISFDAHRPSTIGHLVSL